MMCILTDKKPTMKLLHCMVAVPRLGNNYFRLMDSLRPFWKELASGLGCPNYLIDSIATWMYDHDHVFCVFVEWLRGDTFQNDQPITWGTLITVLHKVSITDVAQILENHLDEMIESS